MERPIKLVPDSAPDAADGILGVPEGSHGVRTPADRVPVPTPGDAGPDLADPAYYLNRELTWLNFNFRVLHESRRRRTPLLERLKFLAIVASNLDEFFMKRIGGLKQQVGAGYQSLTDDGRTAQEQIDECHDVIEEIETAQRGTLVEVLGGLDDHGIRVVGWESLDEVQRDTLRDHYVENIYPLVTPQATDPAHPFPFVSNLSINLLVSLRADENSAPALARVKVPIGLGTPRFLTAGANVFVPLESVMAGNLDLLFPGMIVDGCHTFRVTRNANTEKDEERADDLLALIETELRERKFAPIVRLEVSRGMPPGLRRQLAGELELNEQEDVFEVDGMLALRDLAEVCRNVQLPGSVLATLSDPPHRPTDAVDLPADRDMFETLREVGTVMVHHPYESFSTSVERFLATASGDPNVRAIKMSLYRTSADTKVIAHLIDAARRGKQVAVVVELKARFDEEANIRWAARLEEVGIHVTYGVVGLKTHCKAILVVRQEADGLRHYAHIGTGNYHAGTARLYSDIGLLTARKRIGRDLVELFNYLTTGYKPKREYGVIIPAPKMLKGALLAKIAREAENARAGKRGWVRFKLNALEDAEITRALYEASMAGVEVDLIVRDTCRLRPGIPAVSETCRVVSVVGRFLEHARIYQFHNDADEEIYIGSADVMRRNLNNRVEILVPVTAEAHRKELRKFLDQQWKDRVCTWEMQADGSYHKRDAADDEVGCQEKTIERYERRARKANRLRNRGLQGPRRRPG